MKKLLIFLLILCLSFSVGACSKENVGEYKYELMVGSTIKTLEIGEEFVLSANYTDNETVVTYSSTDETIATVDQAGKVTALKSGVCYIEVTANGEKKSCEITVVDPEYIMELKYNAVDELFVGAKTTISAIVYKDGVLYDADVVWTVTPTNGCKLTQISQNEAVFEGLSAGDYTIKADFGKCDAEVTFKVTALPN